MRRRTGLRPHARVRDEGRVDDGHTDPSAAQLLAQGQTEAAQAKLLALYTDTSAAGILLCMDAISTTCPDFRASMRGTNRLARTIAERRFTSIARLI